MFVREAVLTPSRIDSEDDLSRWLSGRAAEDASVIALRAALRVIPIVAHKKAWEEPVPRSFQHCDIIYSAAIRPENAVSILAPVEDQFFGNLAGADDDCSSNSEIAAIAVENAVAASIYALYANDPDCRMAYNGRQEHIHDVSFDLEMSFVHADLDRIESIRASRPGPSTLDVEDAESCARYCACDAVASSADAAGMFARDHSGEEQEVVDAGSDSELDAREDFDVASDAEFDVWDAVSADANALEAGLPSHKLARRPLWPGLLPTWAAASSQWVPAQQRNQRGEDWLSWYEACVRGRVGPIVDFARGAFVSHAAKSDGPYARGLALELEAAGLPCWIAPRDVPPGVDFGTAILRAIDACGVLILVVPTASALSDYVKSEVTYALNKCKRIIPIRNKGSANLEEVDPRLVIVHCINDSDEAHVVAADVLKSLS